MKNVFLRLSLCIGGWLGLLCSAHAGLIIDTGEPPEPGYGSAFMGSNNGNYQYVAGKIEFASAYQINSIDTHLQFYEPYFASGGAFSIVLYNDDNASGPGNLVYSAGGGYMPRASQGAWYGISGLDWLVERLGLIGLHLKRRTALSMQSCHMQLNRQQLSTPTTSIFWVITVIPRTLVACHFPCVSTRIR